MNIQQLEYLIAVDRYRHFGKAAQACFITQPTLSAMVQKLEEELGVKIFDRTTHPVRTTDIGSEIIIQAKAVTNAVNELRNKADLLKNVLGGKLSLGIIPTVSTYLLPGQVFEFVKENEKISLTVKEMTTENIIKALKAGELDAGIISTPYAAAEEFSEDFLFNEELMVYSSEDHQDNKFVSPEDIDPEKIWLLEEGNCLRTQFESICHLKENTLAPKNLDFVASHIATLIQLVDSVGGITILPELAVAQLPEPHRRNVARFRRPFPYRRVSMVYYRPTYKQRMIDELVRHIRTSLAGKLNYDGSENFVGISPQ